MKWKVNGLVELVKWIVRADTLEPVDAKEEVSEIAAGRSRFGGGGFLRWLFSPEKLTPEPEVSRPASRWGKGGFLGWLFSLDELEEEPVMKRKRSLFGEAGFFKWLVGVEHIDDQADQEETGR